jgi:aryl-alcohol dehydrogenase-like predicted oxidoreductase
MLTGKYRRGAAGCRAEGLGGRVFQPENSPQRTAVLDTVIAVAEETAATPSQVAIAWVASKGPLPIIGRAPSSSSATISEQRGCSLPPSKPLASTRRARSCRCFSTRWSTIVNTGSA